MRTTRLAAVAVAAACLVAGCGGDQASGDGQQIATLRTDGAAGVTGGDAASEGTSGGTDGALEAPEDIEEAMALYQACMEEHGVDGGAFRVAGEASGGDVISVERDESDDAGPPPGLPDVDPEEVEAADEACHGHLANAIGGFDLSPEQQAALEDAQLEWSACMRDHGVDVPEGMFVAAGDGDIAISRRVGGSGEVGDGDAPEPLDIDTDAFNAAAAECQSVYEQYPELDDVVPQGAPRVGTSHAVDADHGEANP